MTVINAKNFIKRAREDHYLRQRLNKSASANETLDILVSENLKFTKEEFVEAHSYLLANSPTIESTVELKEFLMWWGIVSRQ